MTSPYSKRRKAEAVVLADMKGSVRAAGRELGIPHQTITRWQDDPEMRQYVDKTRAELADDIRAAAALFWSTLVRRVKAGDIDTRDLIIASGVAIDKAQLLSGGATARTEHRELTEGLDDHEREALRDAIDSWTSRETAAPAAERDSG